MSNDPSNDDPHLVAVEPGAKKTSKLHVSIEGIIAPDLPCEFGRYVLLDILGEGGMARVFRAELCGPAGFRKLVALKVIKPGVGAQANPTEIMDLIREACLGGRIKHHHIVDVYELGEVDGQMFISMELVEGLTLGQLIRNRSPLPAPVVLEIAVAMAAGLAKAHEFEAGGETLQLVHRDLKPSNILLSWDGAVKIADFGIAIARTNDVDSECEIPTHLQGTPTYMSPEQVMGEPLDGRSDIFALALVIAAMVLRRNPLGNRWVLDQLSKGMSLEAPLLDAKTVSDLNEVIPDLGQLLLHCLEPERNRRMSDAERLGDALQGLQEAVGYTPRLGRWIRMGPAPDERQAPTPEKKKQNEGETVTHSTVLSSVQAVRDNLGPPLDTFVGRSTELAELERLFGNGARLVTLKGTGGTGKTRLCRQFGRKAAVELSGGAWFLDLTEARSVMGVLNAAALALNVGLGRGDAVDALIDKLGHAVAGRGPILLMWDNCEQIVEHASSIIRRWLAMAPEARFLVTSRESLRVTGEEIFALSPLPEKEGVALFDLRAAALGAPWEPSDKNRTAIVQIVRRLDGLPLAIELAAARTSMLLPTQILARLSERFRLLHRAQRDGGLRHTSLRGLIDWSWDLLEPWEQVALAQLSVFRNGFFMEAAEAVLDVSAWPDAPWSLDVVASLFNKSLLHSRVVLGQPRFAMYGSIHEYAAEKLSYLKSPISGSGMAESTRLRHAQYYAFFGEESFLDSLDTYGGVEQCKNLALELENLLVGLDAGLAAGEPETGAVCALAAAAVFGMQGPFSDGIALLERVLGQPVGRRTQGRLFLKAGWLLHSCGRPLESLESFQQALAIHREVGDRRGEGISLRGLALLHRHQARISEALEHYSQALIIAREMGDRGNEGGALAGLATAQHEVGRVSEALECFQQALAIHREMGDRRYEGITLGNLALLHHDQGHNPETLECYSQALAIHREVGSRLYEGNILGGLALLHHDQGNIPEALEHYSQALAIHREVGNRRFEGVALGNLGDLLSSQGDLQSAEASLRGAIAIGDETLPVAAGAFRGSLSLIRAQQGALDEARELLEMGESQVRGVYQLELGKLLCKKARVEHLAGDPSASATALAEAESIDAELAAGPDSDLGRALADAREIIGS